MSQYDLAKKIMNEMLDIFSLLIEKMEKVLEFSYNKVSLLNLIKKFSFLNFGENNIISPPSFETNSLYIFFIKKTYEYLVSSKEIYFNSHFSVLYFKRIIRYLTELLKSNINIVEDDLIKLFFYLLFLFFQEKLENYPNQRDSSLKIDLDETFFKGTFIELTEKYSSQVSYKDSQDLIDIIGNSKSKMKTQIIIKLYQTFYNIREILTQHSDHNDELMKEMYNDAGSILYEIDISCNENTNDLSKDLINKLNNFYSNENYLIFTNYISENQRDDLEGGINQKFLQKKKKVIYLLNSIIHLQII